MCIACDDQRVSKSINALTATKPSLTKSNNNHNPCKKRKSRRKVTFANCNDESKTYYTPKSSHPYHEKENEGEPIRAEIIATIPASSTMSQEERSDVHWQPEDYAYFRGSARVIAQEVKSVSSSTKQTSRSYNSILSRTLEICHIVSQDKTRPSPTESHDPSVELCLPPRLFGALTDWTREGHSRRGIERYCVPSHEVSRPMARKQAIEAVLFAQDLLRQKAFQPGTFQVGDLELPSSLENDEITRRVSLEFTRSSKLYALAMGHADAAAVGNLKKNPT